MHMSSHRFPILSRAPRETLIDRELSWLAFNERVLELAEDEGVPPHSVKSVWLAGN